MLGWTRIELGVFQIELVIAAIGATHNPVVQRTAIMKSPAILGIGESV